MKHLIVIVGGTAAALALAACGSGTAATSSSSTTSTSRPAGTGPGGVARRGAAGELAQINGTSLILNTTAGDVTVGYTTTTTITQTKTGVLADIVPGSCVVITGQKDATGTLVASSVRLSQPVNGACTAGVGNRGPGAGTGTRPNPGGTPRATPAPGQPVPSFAAGSVTAVNGTAVTVQPTTGAAQAVTVPTTVTVSESSAASPTDLTVGDCIQATGAKDSSGTVAATSLSIVPAGPSGCFTGGGAGGFGGRGFGGGGSGGQAPVG
jgi:hypothetical protein